MDWWTWIGLYAAIAIVGGIVATNIMETIQREAGLTRDALEEALGRLGRKLDQIMHILESREDLTRDAFERLGGELQQQAELTRGDIDNAVERLGEKLDGRD